MKLYIKTLLIILVSINISHSNEKLTVYTYDSFVAEWGPGPLLEEKFEKECNCDLELIGLSDGVEILTRIMYEGKNTNADVVLGLDSNLLQRARDTNLFNQHNIDITNLAISNRFDDDVFVPFDYGYFSFIYDSTKTSEPPKSFDDLLQSNNIRIIIQDPRTSTPGLGLLLWIKDIYGSKATEVWAKLGEKIVTVTPGWSEAYGLFLDGEADMVLSYTTSPAYHITYENDYRYKAAHFIEGHYEQIEVAAKLKNTQNDKIADKFLKFIISKEAQDILPTTQWMYPVILEADLPESYDHLIKIENPLRIEPEEIFLNNEQWIREWESSLSN